MNNNLIPIPNNIKYYKSITSNKDLKNESNINIILLSFIINKKSKIIQIGEIDKESEKFIKKNISNPENYIKFNDLNFNFNKFQNNKKIIFDTLLISVMKDADKFCDQFSVIYRQMQYVYFYYNGARRWCNPLRNKFTKKYFYPYAHLPFKEHKDDCGARHNGKYILGYEVLKKGNIRGELGNYNFSYGIDKISRTSIINHLIHKFNLKKYLEIGIGEGVNFNKINIKRKIGIDHEPTSDCKGENIYLMTSDEYFEFIQEDDIKFDIIFIDGDKLEKQVNKDIKNSLKRLKDNGFIILKDVNPPAKYYQRENIFSRGSYLEWNGTVWRSYAELRINNNNLKMCVVNSDWGIGIIQKGKQICYPKPDKLTYGLLDENRINLLNLLSVNDFLMKF